MSSSGNKVNPFELDPYDEWDDGGWGDDVAYAAEDQRLMDEYRPSGGSKNNRHKAAYDRQSNGKRTFHPQNMQGFGSNGNNHSPQLWKYALLAVVLVAVLVLWNDNSDKEHSGDDYISLIDEIPKDDYRLVILGERHSGTTWLHDRLQECYPLATVSSTLKRPGYFFQQEPSKQEQAKHHHQQDTIVLHLTLNIYDWLEQMRASPEYAPNHVGLHEEGHIVPLEWHEFLLKPWTTERPERDLAFQNETEPVCQLGFHYNQVVSCMETLTGGTDNPIYELNQENDGIHIEKTKDKNIVASKPYDSIIEMRGAKIRNHQNVQTWKSVKKFITVPYETAGKEFKSRILDEIGQFAGWKPSCSGNVLPPTRERTASMTKEFVHFVTAMADWDTAESLVSYEPWTEADMDAKGIIKEAATTTPPPTSKPTTANKPKKPKTDKDDNGNGKKTKAPKLAPANTTTTTTAPADAAPVSTNSTKHKNVDQVVSNATISTTNTSAKATDGGKGRRR
ncbi:MAG: hypothetical protein SGILL_001353 [Bacillariaceae sp.]